jgi:hypothetical protein
LLLKKADQNPRALVIFNLVYSANEARKGSALNFGTIAWDNVI